MKISTIANWKAGIFLASLTVISGILLLSYNIIEELRATTRHHLSATVERYRDFLNGNDPEPALKTIQSITFPIILADESGNPLFWKNLPIASDNRSDAAMMQLKHWIAEYDHQGNRPIPLALGNNVVQYFHYTDETLVSQVRYVTITGIGAFILLVLIGYYGFNLAREAENRAMWIGLARETAHQFGTPISSLMGWVELLQSQYPSEKIIGEMDQDITRLRSVLNRFSAIGREEKLIEADLSAVTLTSVDYMQRRLPKRARDIRIDCYADQPVIVRMQPELIGWVLENLLRNAAESIEHGDGVIEVNVNASGKYGCVSIKDNGKGMTGSERRNAFRAGFSTKRKGWGVGLSLAKRIVRDEHHGSLSISTTSRGNGTTFHLELPLMKSNRNAV